MSSKIRTYLSKIFKKGEEGVPLIDRLEDLIESDPQASSEINADDTSELALVSNVLGLKDLTAEDIMVPRANIVAAKIDTSLDEFVEIFSQNSFSQIPIYKDTLDNVVGVVRVRDFLPYIKSPESFNIESLLKEAMYVVPSIQLLELLVEIRASVNHMVLVVDEFGGIDGLVTLHDVVSEIVGEIQQNQSIFPQIITKQDGSLVADAKTPIFKCESLLGLELLKPLMEDEDEEPDVETMGGLAMLLAGRMPTRGETLVHPSGVEFDIIEADPRRVKRILIRKTAETIVAKK
ncbi:MAG: CBS domain-containing protein [Holosporaceae bacterium]|jgi:CBS domain containing-hemolysin-like protein|nr:CBS domain-containing protein [Holosporaceae bacterium]